MGCLNPYTQKELKMHDIPDVEVGRQKANATKSKFENFQSNNGNSYLKKSMRLTLDANKNKYILPPRRYDRKILENQRMKEGICRRCGDKWNPKHRYLLEDKSKKLSTCKVEENSESEEEEEEEEESEDEEEATANKESRNKETPKISLAAMTGISQPQTLKLKGHIKKVNVTELVDTKSTHNFLDIRVTRKLKLFVHPVPDMKVMIADGKKIEKVGKYHKVKIQIQDFKLES